MMNKVFQILFFIAIFVYLFQDIDYFKLIQIISNYSIFGILIYILLIKLSFFILAIRWMYLSDKVCNISSSYKASVVGGVLNMILPAKLGEISKALFLKKYYKYSINNSIANIFIERFLDVIVLLILLLIANIFLIDNEEAKKIFIIVSLLVVSFLIFLKMGLVLKIIKHIPNRFIKIYGSKIIKKITIGFKKKTIKKIIFFTSILWTLYVIKYIVFFNIIAGFDLSIYQILLLFIISSIAFSIPLTPGGVGTFQMAIVFAGSLMNIDKEALLSAGIILHLLMFSTSFIIFSFIIIKDKIKISDFIKRNNK